jgi:membrane-associated PAP2 superfamily phosphatase
LITYDVQAPQKSNIHHSRAVPPRVIIFIALLTFGNRVAGIGLCLMLDQGLRLDVSPRVRASHFTSNPLQTSLETLSFLAAFFCFSYVWRVA